MCSAGEWSVSNYFTISICFVSSSRVLAERPFACATQLAQMQAAAQIQRDIQAGRLGAASQLAGLGQGGLNQALGAAQTGVNATSLPMNMFAQYGQTLGLTPPGTYTPDFTRTQGYNQSGSTFNFGFGGNSMPKF